MRERAHYFHFSAQNAKIADWLAERGRFELSVPSATIRPRFSAKLAGYLA